MATDPPLPHDDDDVVVERPNDALDVLVARDAALVAEAKAQLAGHPGATTPEGASPVAPSTPAKEWTAAIALMVLFMIIALAFISFFRS